MNVEEREIKHLYLSSLIFYHSLNQSDWKLGENDESLSQ